MHGKKGGFDGKAGWRGQLPSISHTTYISIFLDVHATSRACSSPFGSHCCCSAPDDGLEYQKTDKPVSSFLKILIRAERLQRQNSSGLYFTVFFLSFNLHIFRALASHSNSTAGISTVWQRSNSKSLPPDGEQTARCIPASAWQEHHHCFC